MATSNAADAAIVAGLKEYIVGRTDVYARGFFPDGPLGKARYQCVKEPLTDAVLHDHLAGRELIGVYQLDPDCTVRWFCADIDKPDDAVPPPDAGDAWEPPSVWAQVYAEAKAQALKFSHAGLQVYIERSRSGNGAHVWGFLDKPLDAVLVRRAVAPHLIQSVLFDRLYPVQTALTEGKPYGNLIALPYHGGAVAEGNSVFLTALGTAYEPDAFLTLGIQTNSEAVLRHVLSKAPKVAPGAPVPGAPRESRVTVGPSGGRPARPITGVLKLLSPYGCEFMRHAYRERATLKEPAWYAAIGQLTAFEGGRDAAHILSTGHPQYDPNDTDNKFDQALGNPPVGCAYIHEHFPKLACVTCPMTAPYHRGSRKLSDLVSDGGTELESGHWATAVDRAYKLDTGELLNGIVWGMGDLDRYVRFRRSELTVIGAQVAMGKTSSMIQLSSNVARQEFPALVFSAEMGPEGLRERYLAHFSGVDSLALRGERESGRLTMDEKRDLDLAAKHLAQLPLHFNYTATRPETMLLAIERWALRTRRPFENPYVWFFDYLQYGGREKEDENPFDRISRTVKQLKLITKITTHAGTAFSQVGRPHEASDTPDVTWFKGSGEIEAELDVGLVWTGERLEGRFVPRVGTIVKQRNGRSNVRAEYELDQSTATYQAKNIHQPKAAATLFGDGELGDAGDTSGE